MNKLKLLLLPFAVACSFFMFGCSDDDDVIRDYANYEIKIQLFDYQRNNLLNEKHPNSYLNNDIVVKYKDKEYRIEANPEMGLRYNMPKNLGLRYFVDSYGSNAVLSFGEFSPTNNYKGEIFTIEWGDGTVDEIKFDLYLTKKHEKLRKAIYVNGNQYSAESLSIQLFKDVRTVE